LRRLIAWSSSQLFAVFSIRFEEVRRFEFEDVDAELFNVDEVV
jgi:hypothetical protein